MLHRNSKLALGGMWVFPGGRVDPADRDGGVDDDEAARRAAVREAHEEAGLVVDVGSLVWFSHWLPPSIAPKRFATWFFFAPAPSGAVTIDGGEIHDSAWMRPRDALARRDALEIELAPPTWVTLHHLAAFETVADLMADAREGTPTFYETRMGNGRDGLIAMWRGGGRHEAGAPATTGPPPRPRSGPGARDPADTSVPDPSGPTPLRATRRRGWS